MGISSCSKGKGMKVATAPSPLVETWTSSSALLHDWRDERSVQFLGVCQQAMGEQARMLKVIPTPSVLSIVEGIAGEKEDEFCIHVTFSTGSTEPFHHSVAVRNERVKTGMNRDR
jgi:hypothetical protein